MTIDLPPRTFGAPPHSHDHEDEQFYVLEGNVSFLDREQTTSAGPGTLVVLPRGHVHGFWNETDEPARVLLIVSPGEFATFFDEVVRRIRESAAETPEEIGALIERAAAERGVHIRMDLAPPAAQALLP